MTSEGLIKIKVAVYSNPMSSHIFILTNGKLALDTSEIPLFFKIFFFFLFFFSSFVPSGFAPDGTESQTPLHCCHSPSDVARQLVSSREGLLVWAGLGSPGHV